MSEQEAPPATGILARSPIWQDITARRLLMLGVLTGGLHLIVVAMLLPGLPAEIPLHAQSNGAVLLTGPPNRLFLPALFGLLAWLANLVVGAHFFQQRKEPTVAYILWGASLAVQLGAWYSLRLIML